MVILFPSMPRNDLEITKIVARSPRKWGRSSDRRQAVESASHLAMHADGGSLGGMLRDDETPVHPLLDTIDGGFVSGRRKWTRFIGRRLTPMNADKERD